MTTFPLRLLPGNGEFSVVREFLRGSGYSEEFLLTHFQVPGLHLLLTPYGLHGSYLGARYQGQGLPLFLARLLMAGYPATLDEQRRYLPEAVRDALLALGILEPAAPAGSGALQSTVILHPQQGLWVAGDRGLRPSGVVYQGADFVMSGAENLSRRYLEGFSRSPCERLLEIGTGAGVGAMIASRFSRHVVATDIAPRAAAFARFNCRLNGITNVEVLEGDLFAPVRGYPPFDRILSHPPFEPSLKGDYVFSAAGEDGEAVIERLTREGLPFLSPGARAYYQVVATDRVAEPFEQRVLRWLGGAAPQADVAVLVRLDTTPTDYATEQILARNDDAWKLMEWKVMYEKIRAIRVIVGWLILQRPASPRPVFRTRRVFGPNTGQPEIERLLEWETAAMQPGFAQRVLASRFCTGDGWQLYARHAVQEGRLATLSYTFFSRYPFETNLHCPGWMPLLVSQANGACTGAELLAQLQARIPLQEDEFVRASAALAGMDVLKLLE